MSFPKMSFPFHSNRMDTNIDSVDDNNRLGDDLNISADVLSVALEAFTSVIIDFGSAHYNMAHYSKEYTIMYDRFVKIVSLLFKMELDPSKQLLVTPQYAVQCMFSDKNYTSVEYTATARGEIQRKPRYV
jgi:hypothetical protein